MNDSTQENWDKAYEFRAISLLWIGFGLVGLDRFIIAPLFPVISEDLGLNYQDLGLIAGVLALTWGLAALVTGNLSDRVGHKRVLVISTIAFSALVAASGLATGLVSFLLIRGMMGFAEGGFVPASIVATVQASKPSRLGFTVGLQQMAAPAVGLFLGPLIAVGLLRVLPGWEWVFATVAIPGFIIAYLFARVIRNKPGTAQSASDHEPPAHKPAFRDAFRYRNVVFGAIAMIGLLSALHTMSALMPNYLTDYVGLTLEQMGLVLAGLGLGGLIGMIAIPALSDRYGRKSMMSISMAVALVALFGVTRETENVPLLAFYLFLVSAMISGVVAITLGPLVNTSVPPSIAATATGIVAGIGEMAGGAFAPAIAGGVAQAQGIQIVPYFSLVACAFGLIVVLFGIKEPQRG